MGEPQRKYRGRSRSREEAFDAVDATVSQRAAFRKCGAIFHSEDGKVWTCPRFVDHPGPHCGDVDGQSCWFDGDDYIVMQGAR